MGSGDACVALARGEIRSRDQDEGDASVPTPTGPKGLAKRHDKIPTRVSGRGVGTLASPIVVVRYGRGTGRGRRKRPHTTPHPPPPLRVRIRFPGLTLWRR